MPRHRLPEDERKEILPIRLKKKIIDDIKKMGNPSEIVEKAIKQYISRENKPK